MQLTEKQLNVKNAALNAKPGDILTLRGYAGTGKTVTTSEIIKSLSHKRVLVAAPTLAALAILRSKLPHTKSYVTFKSVASFLTQPRSFVDIMRMKFDLDDEGMKKFRQFLVQIQCFNENIVYESTRSRKNHYTNEIEHYTDYTINTNELEKVLKKKFKNITKEQLKTQTNFEPKPISEVLDFIQQFDYIFIDEASMISKAITDQIKSALDESLKINPKRTPIVMYCGDEGQLETIEGVINPYIKAKADNQSIFELTDILRSTNEVAKLANMVRSGVKIPQLCQVSDKFTEHVGTVENLIDKYGSHFEKANIVLSFTNKHVDLFNHYMRKVKGFADTPQLKSGEQIMITANCGKNSNNETIFANGEEYYVNKVFNPEEAFELINTLDGYKPLLNNNAKTDQVKASIESISLMGDYILVELIDKLNNSKYAWVSNDLNYQKGANFTLFGKNLEDASQICNGFAPLVYATFGYARTIDKAQGAEWTNGIYVVLDYQLYYDKKTNRPYTALSRFKEDFEVFYVTKYATKI